MKFSAVVVLFMVLSCADIEPSIYPLKPTTVLEPGCKWIQSTHIKPGEWIIICDRNGKLIRMEPK